MPAGSFQAYKVFPYRAARQEFAFLSGTVKMLLATNTYVPNLATHVDIGDVTNECADGDYSRQTLSTKTITQDGSSRTVYDADDVSFGSVVTISARYAILCLDTGTEATSYLMGYIDLNGGVSGNVSSSASPFVVRFNASGIYRITP